VRWISLGLLVVSFLSFPLQAANDSAILDPAVATALQKRWPRPLVLIQLRLNESSRDRPAVFSALQAAAEFLRVDGLRGVARTDAKTAAARNFRAGLDALGPSRGRFLGREGGLGEIAREVLGAEAFVNVLDETTADQAHAAGLLSVRAEALYDAGRHQEAAVAAREAWELSQKKDMEALTILRLSEGRGSPSRAAASSASPRPAGADSLVTSAAASAADARPIVMTKMPKRSPLVVPGIDHFNILDDEAAAPEPSAVDRIMAFVSPSKNIVTEDLKTLQSRIGDFDIPAETISLGSENFEAPRQFVSWIKTVSSKDLPDISYGTLPAGKLASYKPGILGGKGKIVMNYYIRNAEPLARSAVLFHELYHYWDFEVAQNPYPNVSYGHHSKEGLARREYDPYYLTALYWAQVNPGDAGSPLAKSLCALPSNTDELQRRVDALVSRRKDDK